MPARPCWRSLNSGRAPSEKLPSFLRSSIVVRLFFVAYALVVAMASTSSNGVGSLTVCPRPS